MRFSLELPTARVDRADEFVNGDAVAEMAVAAETAGFDAVFVTEHPAPSTEWLASGGHHALEPWVALAFAAAATSTLRLQSHLAIAAYRSPFLLAKAAASLDVLSGGRVVLGMGTGYLEAEFAALGVDFARRNELFDACLVMLPRIWSGEEVDGTVVLPRPVQRPGPPMWVGGNSQRAMRRAAELADGWAPMAIGRATAARVRSPSLRNLDDLAVGVAELRRLADAAGRERRPDVVFMPLSRELTSDEVDAQAKAGVTQMMIGFPAASSRAEFIGAVERFGRTFIDPTMR